MSEQPKCELCGEPMPEGEEMFKYHGYSGNCPKPPLPRPTAIDWKQRAEAAEARAEALLKYARHQSPACVNKPGGVCWCGLNAALAAGRKST